MVISFSIKLLSTEAWNSVNMRCAFCILSHKIYYSTLTINLRATIVYASHMQSVRCSTNLSSPFDWCPLGYATPSLYLYKLLWNNLPNPSPFNYCNSCCRTLHIHKHTAHPSHAKYHPQVSVQPYDVIPVHPRVYNNKGWHQNPSLNGREINAYVCT
jgi:hypothetical protein